MGNVKRSVLACAVTALFSLHAHADYKPFFLNDSNGVPMIEMRVFAPGDGNYYIGRNGPYGSWRSLSLDEIDQMRAGLNYWANVVKVVPGKSPAIINVGTVTDEGANAGSPTVPGWIIAPTQVQAVLQNMDPGGLWYDSHGVINIGKMQFGTEPYIPSQLPLISNGSVDLSVVLLHEFAHAMGINSNVLDEGSRRNHLPVFAPSMSLWTAGLRDDNGQASQPGQTIWCHGCVNPASDNVFDVRQETAYFTGKHVDEVLANAMRGIPVVISDKFGNVDTNYMAHIELKNSLMSHQEYRNYTTFMEAELAALQDLGYNIDRRNFFGRSVYNNGQTIVNDKGYFGRNADGTAYVANTYNTAYQGLGLHIYGSNNTLYQRADILSAGAGGGGVRVDGEGNTLTILPGTRVYADGAYARGVMFAYGKNHRYVQQGDVRANGNHGIAASFDFGNNILGNTDDYRGSYLHLQNGVAAAALDELNGPLVTSVDLTGNLAGRYASIYIADNAYVGQINVMHGATLTGDIYSFYNRQDTSGAQRITGLNFGLMADANGEATNQADANFAMRYNGNITGINNIALNALGGIIEMNGTHQLYSAAIAPGAILSGNSQYTLNTAGTFTNDGTLAVGANGNTSIAGNYVQGATGVLQAGISGNNILHNLAVTGNASIAGTLSIAPQRSWFANGAQFVSDEWITASNLTGAFSAVTTALDSPTLTATAADMGNNKFSVTLSRLPNAYAKQANNQTGSQIGSALDAIANNASADMQPLFTALDFSAKDGSQIRSAFTQLSPAPYSEMFHGSLLRERQISQLVAGAGFGSGNAVGNQSANAGWNTFAIPFGSHYRHSASSTAVGSSGDAYGVVFGGESTQQNWTLGVHGAVSNQTTRVTGDTLASGKNTALDLGAHLRFASNPYQGPHAFALARLGVEDASFDRTVMVNGYSAKPTSKWTGVTATTALGGGWRVQIGEASSIGPIAGLDYTVLQRPDVTETGGAGANLHLGKQNFTSLRAHVGGEWLSTMQTAAGKALTASVQAAWHHELRDTAVNQTASFAGYQGNSFGATNTVMKKDSASIQAALAYQVKQAMQLKAGLSATMWKGGDTQVAGSVSVNWKF